MNEEGDMKEMILTITVYGVAVRVMRYYNSMPYRAMPVRGPFRGLGCTTGF